MRFCTLGVLISGGTSPSKVELYNLVTKTSCDLPDLTPLKFKFHTSVNGVLCGGWLRNVVNRCYDLTSGTWSTSKYQPIRSRRTHVAWNINPGKSFMLLGGGWTNGRNADKNVRTTDIVHFNGTVEQGFMLQYDVK